MSQRGPFRSAMHPWYTGSVAGSAEPTPDEGLQMAAPISRRTFLAAGAAGAAAAAGLAWPGVAAYADDHSSESVGFTLNADVLDGGEQVTSITLNTAQLGPIDPASLTTGTFRVHAKATSPIPIAPGDLIFSEYDLDRPVTAVRLDHGQAVRGTCGDVPQADVGHLANLEHVLFGDKFALMLK